MLANKTAGHVANKQNVSITFSKHSVIFLVQYVLCRKNSTVKHLERLDTISPL